MDKTFRARMRIRAILAKFPSENIVLKRKTNDTYGQPTGTAATYATYKCWRTAIDRGDNVKVKDAGALHDDQKGITVVLLDVTDTIKHGDIAVLANTEYTITNIYRDSVDVRWELTLV